MRGKKLYITILAFVFVIFSTYSFFVTKTEAPKIPEELIAQQKAEALLRAEKYTIVNRSLVAPKNILNKQKIVLLTIDDGPSSRTEEMISILKNHKAKAIFFVNGIHNKGYPGVIEKIKQEGFVVGNHTWSHINLKKINDTILIEKEINKNTDLINKLTGNNSHFFRAPYGESNSYIRKLTKDNGMIFMDWSGATMDWDKSTVEKDVFINNVMNKIHSGSIILIHEHPWSVANLDALLTDIESKGYTYVDPNNIIE